VAKKTTTKKVPREAYAPRLRQAQERIDVATLLVSDPESQDPALVLAVQAAIAAADALTIYFRGERSSSESHGDAAQVLNRLELPGIEAARKNLVRLLGQKTKIEYSGRRLSARDAARLVERARDLVAFAQSSIRGADPGS